MKPEHARRVYEFHRIQRAVPLAAVLQRYGVLQQLKKVGRQYFGTCPIHGGSNPKQFVVDLEKNVWCCFGDCDQKGGSTFEFVRDMEGRRISLFQAAQLVAEWFAIPTVQSAKMKRRQATSRSTISDSASQLELTQERSDMAYQSKSTKPAPREEKQTGSRPDFNVRARVRARRPDESEEEYREKCPMMTIGGLWAKTDKNNKQMFSLKINQQPTGWDGSAIAVEPLPERT